MYTHMISTLYIVPMVSVAIPIHPMCPSGFEMSGRQGLEDGPQRHLDGGHVESQ